MKRYLRDRGVQVSAGAGVFLVGLAVVRPVQPPVVWVVAGVVWAGLTAWALAEAHRAGA